MTETGILWPRSCTFFELEYFHRNNVCTCGNTGLHLNAEWNAERDGYEWWWQRLESRWQIKFVICVPPHDVVGMCQSSTILTACRKNALVTLLSKWTLFGLENSFCKSRRRAFWDSWSFSKAGKAKGVTVDHALYRKTTFCIYTSPSTEMYLLKFQSELTNSCNSASVTARPTAYFFWKHFDK